MNTGGVTGDGGRDGLSGAGPREPRTRKRKTIMPVLARFYGIVIRLICLRQLGTRLHAFYEGAELVMDVQTLKVIQGDVPQRVRDMVVEWARAHYQELLSNSALMLLRQRPVGIES